MLETELTPEIQEASLERVTHDLAWSWLRKSTIRLGHYRWSFGRVEGRLQAGKDWSVSGWWASSAHTAVWRSVAVGPHAWPPQVLYCVHKLADRDVEPRSKDWEQEGGRRVWLISENSLSLGHERRFSRALPPRSSAADSARPLPFPVMFWLSVFSLASQAGVEEPGTSEFELWPWLFLDMFSKFPIFLTCEVRAGIPSSQGCIGGWLQKVTGIH